MGSLKLKKNQVRFHPRLSPGPGTLLGPYKSTGRGRPPWEGTPFLFRLVVSIWLPMFAA